MRIRTSLRKVIPTACASTCPGALRTVAVCGLVVLASAHATVAGATNYYVSNAGADTNDGRTPGMAWATLGRVNEAPLEPGDSVLFRRGDQWRGQLAPHSGNESGPITYGAYGSGEKPLVLGSVEMNDASLWSQERPNIWATRERKPGDPQLLPRDVGNIIFDGERSCGIKVWNESDLDTQGEFWYDKQRRVLKLYSTECPTSRYSDIEFALTTLIVNQNGRCYVTYENLAFKYGGAHGIGGGNTHHILVRDCDFSYMGGGDLYGGDRTVRFGNGIEFWGNAHDNVVERCRLWEIYDAALTNQNHGATVQHHNISYRNNVIWNSEYSFEYWNRPESSVTHDIYFENNTCVNAGGGWGHNQRPDPSGRHLCFYSSPAAASEIHIRNNIFFEAKSNALYAVSWPSAAFAALDLDRNCWFQAQGDMIALNGKAYPMAQFAAYQAEQGKEAHSITSDPGFINAAAADLHLAGNSPCIDAGTDVGIRADFQGTPIPQGKAPDIGAYELPNRPPVAPTGQHLK